jgi:hypothetical protein
MSAAHTPGPWRVTGPNIRAGDALLAMVTDHWANETTPDAEKMANARLIAAAPELLAALQAILHDTTHDLAGLPRDEALDLIFTVADTAHAAIQRANGAL